MTPMRVRHLGATRDSRRTVIVLGLTIPQSDHVPGLARENISEVRVARRFCS